MELGVGVEMGWMGWMSGSALIRSMGMSMLTTVWGTTQVEALQEMKRRAKKFQRRRSKDHRAEGFRVKEWFRWGRVPDVRASPTSGGA